MKTYKEFAPIFFTLFISTGCSAGSTFHEKHKQTGNDNYKLIEEITSKRLVLGNCKLSISTKENQIILESDPETVIYIPTKDSNFESFPYLSQEELSSGYQWSFRKDKNLAEKWFGLMCEDTKNFSSLSSPQEKKQNPSENLSLQLVKEFSDSRCPAVKKNGRWVPTASAENKNGYTFRELEGENWNGFIFGFKQHGSKTLERMGFCLIHKDKVLIGVAENYPTPLSMPEEFMSQTQALLESIIFED